MTNPSIPGVETMSSERLKELAERVDFERGIVDLARMKYRNARARYRLAKRQFDNELARSA